MDPKKVFKMQDVPYFEAGFMQRDTSHHDGVSRSLNRRLG
jgi:hypothetical protein